MPLSTASPAESRSSGYWSPRLATTCIVAGVVAFCALGFWGMWPWLVVQCQRVGPISVAELWLGDLFALLWFLWAAGSVFALGGGRVAIDDSLRRRRIAIVVSLALGLLLRVAFTIASWHGERVAYRTGAVTTAQVVAVTRGDAPYILHCRFTDSAGKPIQSEIRVFNYRDEPVPAGLGVRWREQLSGKPVPFPITIRYDRKRPQRCWVEGAGTAHANDLLPFSLLVILFEGSLLPLIWEFTRPTHRAFRLVMDFELHRLAPLTIEACILAFFGLLVALNRLG